MPSSRYLIVHAYFDCRKSYKVAPRPDHVAICPGCGGTLHEMGRSFKAPPAKDKEQWAKVESLFAAGFRFFSYRSKRSPGKRSAPEATASRQPGCAALTRATVGR